MVRRMTNKRSAPKRQHYVPRLYLRNFAIPHKADSKIERVHVYERGGTKPRVSGINKIAVVKDFYTVIDPETDEKDYSLEEFFNSIEGIAAREIAGLITNDNVVFDEERKRKLAPFIGCLAVRTLQHLQWEENFLDEESKRYSSLLQQDPESFLKMYFSEEVLEVFGEDRILEIVKDETFIGGVLDNLSQTRQPRAVNRGLKIANILMKKNWILGIRETSKVLVTSDHPVVTLRPQGVPEKARSGFAKGIICMPLSPDRCLIMFHQKLKPGLPSKSVDSINHGQMHHAHKEIYSHANISGIQNQFNKTKEGEGTEVKLDW